jgi:hypothetical protein
MEQLCKDLTTTYDTNILDNQYPIVQQEFLKVSRKNRNNKGGNCCSYSYKLVRIFFFKIKEYLFRKFFNQKIVLLHMNY